MEDKHEKIMQNVLERERLSSDEENAVKTAIEIACAVQQKGGSEEEAFSIVNRNIKANLEENDDNASLSSVVKKSLTRKKVSRRINHLSALVCEEVYEEMQGGWNIEEKFISMFPFMKADDSDDEEYYNSQRRGSRRSVISRVFSRKSRKKDRDPEESASGSNDQKKKMEFDLVDVERDFSVKADELMTQAVNKLQPNDSAKDIQDEKEQESREEGAQPEKITEGDTAEKRTQDEKSTSRTGRTIVIGRKLSKKRGVNRRAEEQSNGITCQQGAKETYDEEVKDEEKTSSDKEVVKTIEETTDKPDGVNTGNSVVEEQSGDCTSSLFQGFENAILVGAKELKAQSYNWMLSSKAEEDSDATSRNEQEKLKELVDEGNHTSVNDETKVEGGKSETAFERVQAITSQDSPSMKEVAAC